MPAAYDVRPDRHGVHAHCPECGWEGPPGMSRSRAISLGLKHRNSQHRLDSKGRDTGKLSRGDQG